MWAGTIDRLVNANHHVFNSWNFVSWVGLRSSVPIVLATFPLAAGIAQAGEIFVVVSFIVVMSVLIQRFSLVPVARRLGLAAID